MNNRQLAVMALCTLLGFGACSEKKQTNDIIVPKIVKKAQKKINAMSDYSQSKSVDWLGQTYTVVVHRFVDKTVQCEDESGNKYYANKISLRIHRADGSVFFDRTFTKQDFERYLNSDVAEKGALLGIVLENAEGDHLRFAASVGSPDQMSDEFVPLVLNVSRTGGISVSVDTSLDVSD